MEDYIVAAVDNYFAQGTEIKGEVSISSHRYHFLRLFCSLNRSTHFHSKFCTAKDRDVDALSYLYDQCSFNQPFSSCSSAYCSHRLVRVSLGFISSPQSVRDEQRAQTNAVCPPSSTSERRSPTMDESFFVVWPPKRIRTNWSIRRTCVIWCTSSFNNPNWIINLWRSPKVNEILL